MLRHTAIIFFVIRSLFHRQLSKHILCSVQVVISDHSNIDLSLMEPRGSGRHYMSNLAANSYIHTHTHTHTHIYTLTHTHHAAHHPPPLLCHIQQFPYILQLYDNAMCAKVTLATEFESTYLIRSSRNTIIS